MSEKARPVIKGIEDRFSYYITRDCIGCKRCTYRCPVGAIVPQGDIFQVLKEKCIDCGTCSYVCPVGAAKPV